MTIRNDQLLCVEDEIAINNTWAANYKIYTYEGDGDGIFGGNWKNRAGARESE